MIGDGTSARDQRMLNTRLGGFLFQDEPEAETA